MEDLLFMLTVSKKKGTLPVRFEVTSYWQKSNKIAKINLLLLHSVYKGPDFILLRAHIYLVSGWDDQLMDVDIYQNDWNYKAMS
jgi:hypothetical protein